MSLALLRAHCEGLRSEASLRRWQRALRDDPRDGARAVAAAVDRRLREHQRLGRLFAARRRLRAAGARWVAGVDEVGVGPLAGPLVAAAVVLPDDPDLPGLNDSKRLTRIARERLAESIRAQALACAVAEIPAPEVDRMNVYRASLEAMRRAVVALRGPVDHVMVDARILPGIDVPQTALVGGDGLDASIAAASIVAKVHRDALMRRFCARYPGYDFARHKGYATSAHLAALRRLGPSPIHRRSFAPVAQGELPWS